MERSDSIKELAKALNLFHSKCGKIKKDSNNPFFKSKYASLSNILDVIDVPLSESGLVFSQFPDGDFLTTILIHFESGEFMSASYSINPVPEYTKEKDRDGNVLYRGESFVSPQSIGSAITYARRYALGAILGLNIDEDDDANAASGKTQAASNGHHVPGKIEPKAEGAELPWMTEEEFKKTEYEIRSGNWKVFEAVSKARRMKKAYRESLEESVKFSKQLA